MKLNEHKLLELKAKYKYNAGIDFDLMLRSKEEMHKINWVDLAHLIDLYFFEKCSHIRTLKRISTEERKRLGYHYECTECYEKLDSRYNDDTNEQHLYTSDGYYYPYDNMKSYSDEESIFLIMALLEKGIAVTLKEVSVNGAFHYECYLHYPGNKFSCFDGIEIHEAIFGAYMKGLDSF